jgi:hypothetical protein
MRTPISIALLFVATPIMSASSQADRQANAPAAISQLIGVWRGHSECAVPNSPCHDETNVYRISEVAGNSNEVHIVGTKIVDGKEIAMGAGDWHYDAAQHVLQTETPAGTFRFNFDGGSMEGVLTLPDHSVYRRIHVKKDN